PHRARRPRRHRPAHLFRPRDAVMTPPGPPDVGPAVVIADGTSAGVLSQVIADAFTDLAVSRWLIPDPAVRHRIFPGYFRLRGARPGRRDRLHHPGPGRRGPVAARRGRAG